MANDILRASDIAPFTANLAARRGYPRQFRFVTYGDSKSRLMGGLGPCNSSLRLALIMHPIDYRLDPGADNLGVNGKLVATTSGDLASDAVMAPMLARFDAGQNVMIFKGFTNNTGGSVAQGLAAFRKIHVQARAHGCQLMIIMGVNPTAGQSAANARLFESFDQALRLYERQNDDVWYVPTTPALLDFSSAARAPITVPRAVMTDGIHESGYGAFLEAQVLAREFQRRGVPRRYPSVFTAGDEVNGPPNGDPQSPAGNFLGAMGTFSAFGNSAGMGVTTSGSGTITGAANWVGPNDAQNRCQLSGTLNGSVSLAITQQASPYLTAEAFRSDAILRPRLTLSGTATAKFGLSVSMHRNVYQNIGSGASLPYPALLESEISWTATTVKGATQIGGPGSFGGTTIGVNDQYPTFSGLMHDASFLPYDGGGSTTFGVYEVDCGLYIEFAPNVDLTGTTIDLIGAAVRQIYPVQPAAA